MQRSLKKKIESVTKEVNTLYYKIALENNSLSMFVNLYTTIKQRSKKIKIKKNIWKCLVNKNLPDVINYWQNTVNLELRELFFKKIKKLVKQNHQADQEILAIIFEFHKKNNS